MFLQLVRNLTPGQSPVLRIGGDSTDWAWYPVPGLSKPKACGSRSPRAGSRVMHAVATDLNARLIMGIDLEADSRAVADGEASAFERVIGKPMDRGARARQRAQPVRQLHLVRPRPTAST